MGVEAKLTYNLDEATLKRAADLMRQFGRQADLTEDEIEDLTRSLDDMGRKGKKSTNEAKESIGGLGSVAKKVGPAIAALFAVDKAIDLTREIVRLTSEAQKMQAVLENALGSRSAARIGMQQIVEFAAKTNFSVAELTSSYVKLVNQGFKPTQDEMRKLADLSNSTGKQFDQLTEAIIDAQVGEFERLKEFGIRAQKEGDNVTFTFKGVERQVDFTNDAIRAYILSLGDVEGVSGSTDKISKTLGGSISNLGDSFDRLLVILGSIGSPTIIKGIDMLGDALDKISGTLISDEQRSFTRAAEAFRDMGGEAIRLTEAERILAQLRSESNDMLHEQLDAQAMVKSDMQQSEAAQLAIIDLKLSGLDVTKEQEKAEERIIDDLEDNLQLQQIIQDHIKRLQEQAANAPKPLEDIDTAPAVDGFKDIERAATDVEKAMERVAMAMKEAVVEQTREQRLQVRSAIADTRAEQISLAGESIALAESTANTINFINEERRARDRENLRQEMESRLALVGDNESAQLEIREEFAERERQMEQEQAEARRRLFLFSQLASVGEVWINTAIAVAKAVAASPITFGEPWATYARIQGGIQTAIIGAQTIPAFAKGTESVEGPEGNDKVLSWLTRKERVVDVSRNQRIGNLDNEELTRAAEIYRSIPGHLRGDLWQAAASGEGIDVDALAAKTSKPIVDEIRRSPGIAITIDRYGQAVDVTRQQSHRRYLQKKFGIKIRT